MKRLNLRGVEKDPNEKSIEDILVERRCTMGPSGCGACLGGPVDTLAVCRPRRFASAQPTATSPGRMGSTKSAVYLGDRP